MNRTYLLNSPVITDYGDWRLSGPLSPEQARALVDDGFESAIGHAGAAETLGAVLEREIPVQRRSVRLAVGDRALVLRLTERLPEGTVLQGDALQATPWELALLERLR